jgi:hypothetical protein
MKKHTFVGRIKIIETQFGEIIKIGLSKQDREKLEQYQSQSGWVNINIMTSPQGKKYATIDTYGLEKEVKQDRPSTSTNTPDEINLEQIPF